MTETWKGMSRRKVGQTEEEEERQLLLESMARTRTELNQAYAEFNSHSDPDLVDSCVYTINALRSRYSYFIRRMKLLDEEKEVAG